MALLNDYLRDRGQQGNGVSVPRVNVTQTPQPKANAASVGAVNAQSMLPPEGAPPAPEEVVGEQPTPPTNEVAPEDVALAEEVVDPTTQPTGVNGVDDPRYNWVPRMAPGYAPTMSDIIERGAAAGQERLDYQIQQWERTHDPMLYEYDIYGRTALPNLPRLELAPPTVRNSDFATAPDLFRNTGLGFQGQLNPTGNALQSRNGTPGESGNTLGQIVRGVFGIPETVDTLITQGLNAVGLTGFAEWRDDNLSLRQVSRTVENVAGGQGLGEAWSNAQQGNVQEGTQQLSTVGAETVRQLGDTGDSVYGSGVPGAAMRALDFPGQAIRGFGSDVVEAGREAYNAATQNGGFDLGTFLTYESEYDDLEAAVNAEREFSFMVPQGESGLGYTPIREGEQGTFLPGGVRARWLPGWVTGLVLDAVTEIPGEQLIEGGVQALVRNGRRQAANAAGEVAEELVSPGSVPPNALPGSMPTPDVPLLPSGSPSNVPNSPVRVFVPPSQVTNLPGAARRTSEDITAARTAEPTQVTVLGGEAATQPTRRYVPDVIVDVEAVDVTNVLPSTQTGSNFGEITQLQRNFLEAATRTFNTGAARQDVATELRQLQAAQTLDVRDLARNIYTVPQGLDVGTYDGTVRDGVQRLLPAAQTDNVAEATPTYSPDIQMEALGLAQDRAIREGVPVDDDMVRQAAEDLRTGNAQGVNFPESMSPMVRMTEQEMLDTFDSVDNVRRLAEAKQIAIEGRNIRDVATDLLMDINKTGNNPANVRYFDSTEEIDRLYPYSSGIPAEQLTFSLKRIFGEQSNATYKVGSRVPLDGTYNSSVKAGTTRGGVVLTPNEELAQLQAIAAQSPNAISRAEQPTVYATNWTPSKPVTPGTSYARMYVEGVRTTLSQAGLGNAALKRLDAIAGSKPMEVFWQAVDREVGRAGLSVEEVGFTARVNADSRLRELGYDAVVDTKGNVRPLVNIPMQPVTQLPNVPLARAHGAAHDVARQVGDEVGAAQHRLLANKYVQEELKEQLDNLDTLTRQAIDQTADTQARLEAKVQQDSIQRERAMLQQASVENTLNEADEFLEDTLFPSGDNFCV